MGFMMQHLGCPYSEELLSSKKLLLSFSFKTLKVPKTSPWAGHWSKVTKGALNLWVECLNAKWDRTQRAGRRQPTKSEGENLLEQCYLVLICLIVSMLWAVFAIPSLKPLYLYSLEVAWLSASRTTFAFWHPRWRTWWSWSFLDLKSLKLLVVLKLTINWSA